MIIEPCRELARASLEDVMRFAPLGSGLPLFGAVKKFDASAAPFDPSQLTNIDWWLTADTGYAAGTWTNQIGVDSNKNATQATAGKRPTLNASNAAMNNRPTVDFDGVDDELKTGTWAIAPTMPWTMFVCMKSSGWTGGNNYIWSGLADPPATNLLYGGTAGILKTTAGNLVDAGDPGTSPFAFIAVYDGASSKYYLNAKTSAPFSGNPGTQIATGWGINGYMPADVDVFRWPGSVAQIGAVRGAIDNTEAGSLLDYFGTKYGFAIGP